MISYYGLPAVQPLIEQGLGLWLLTVFSNQAVLVGPPDDLANIRGLADAVEAFRRIARTRSLFVVNNSATELYLTQVLWESAGRPDRTGWYIDQGLREQFAVQAAAGTGAYTTWGLVPFLRSQDVSPQSELPPLARSRAIQTRMQVLVSEDPLFQRMMVAVVVNPARISGVNVEGARAFQSFLTRPATQARIRAFRYPGLDIQGWWPAARNNTSFVLTRP